MRLRNRHQAISEVKMAKTRRELMKEFEQLRDRLFEQWEEECKSEIAQWREEKKEMRRAEAELEKETIAAEHKVKVLLALIAKVEENDVLESFRNIDISDN